MKKWKKGDLLALISLVVLILAIVLDGVTAKMGANAGAKAGEIPADAVTLTGAARGMNGDVTVEVVATADRIYRIRVLDENETNGIGSVAVSTLPGRIYDAQSLQVDAVTSATVTSNAIKEAVRSALLSGGLDPTVFDRAVEQTARAEDLVLEADVVIVGAGGAGMTAAIEAADAGCSVILVESMPMVGGNSIRSTGGLNAAETDYQDENEFAEAAGVEKQLAAAEKYADNETITALAQTVMEQWEAWQKDPQGYFDSVELFELDTMIGGQALNNPELVRRLAEDSNDAIAWLETIGADMPSVSSFGGASVKRIHRPVNDEGKTVSVGAYLVPVLEENLTSRGVTLLLETRAEEILMDGGRAVGIRAVGSTGNTVTIHAKAVVLAAGGFGANHELVESYRPDLEGFMSTNAAGVQGQGIEMAVSVGADTVDMEQIQIHPTVQADTGALITEGLRGDGAILVNQEGERFYDEVSTRDKVSAAEIAQTGASSWPAVGGQVADASAVIQGYISKGLTVQGDSYAALAEAMGVPADVFTATMEKWNECVAAKEDPEFGRTSFAQPLDTAPYYAIHVTAGIHHTMGGVVINEDTQVLNRAGEPIPGLFAAGEITGGVHGGNRLGGNAVADFVVFGRIAGQSAADFAASALANAA